MKPAPKLLNYVHPGLYGCDWLDRVRVRCGKPQVALFEGTVGVRRSCQEHLSSHQSNGWLLIEQSTPKQPACECGSQSVDSPKHSTYCQLFKPEENSW